MNPEIKAIQDEIEKVSGFVERYYSEAEKVIIGQKKLLKSMLMSLLSESHILIEGLPGLAKTLAAKTFASLINAESNRIQFTPDLLPSDITGTMIYNQKNGSFEPRKGPVFTNVLLADEINRSPAKVQSALLESMQERQVTIGDNSYKLPWPFIVIATENPIEQEGTYPLPEAQIDRFMLKLKLNYPQPEEEIEVLRRMSVKYEPALSSVISQSDLKSAVDVYDKIYVDEKLFKYISDLIAATREPLKYNVKVLDGMVQYGASPRAGIFLVKAAKANAFLNHRGYTTPEDVREAAVNILAHRIIPTYEAEAEGIAREDIVNKILDVVEVP